MGGIFSGFALASAIGFAGGFRRSLVGWRLSMWLWMALTRRLGVAEELCEAAELKSFLSPSFSAVFKSCAFTGDFAIDGSAAGSTAGVRAGSVFFALRSLWRGRGGKRLSAFSILRLRAWVAPLPFGNFWSFESFGGFPGWLLAFFPASYRQASHLRVLCSPRAQYPQHSDARNQNRKIGIAREMKLPNRFKQRAELIRVQNRVFGKHGCRTTVRSLLV